MGYNVCDVMECTQTGIAKLWLDFINGKLESIDEIISAYEKLGFDALQDLPGNLYWEQLYDACPDAKIILTVRDNDEIWYNSWYKLRVLRLEVQNNVRVIVMTLETNYCH